MAKQALVSELKPLSVNVETAAKLLGISRNLAYRLAAEGKIPTVKIGDRRLVVPYAVLEQMLSTEVK